MNEAMPHWRSFSSDGAADPEPQHDGPEPGGRRWTAHPRLVAAALLAVPGGVALIAAVVLAAFSLAGAQGSPALLAVGDPLDGSGAPSGRPGAAAGAGIVAQEEVAAEIVVDVGGAVADPGLHRLRTGDRVGDAIAAAGGFGSRVDISAAGQSLNLAAALHDGDKILVPELGTEGPLGVTDAGAGQGLVDLNSADQAALEALPGIGPVTAQRILEARSEQVFASVEEILARGVVGDSVFEDIRELVTVGG